MELSLTGTVVASRRSLVASEVSGIVDRFHIRVGDRVRAGDPLARLRTTPVELRIEAARAQLAESEATLRSAELRLGRLQELSSSEVVSRQSVDDALFEKQAAAARVDRSRATLHVLDDQLERSTIRAPFDGAVVAEHTQAGQWLEAGGPVVELVALDDMEIVLDVPEIHRRTVAAGAKARLLLESPGLGIGHELDGEVRALVPNATASARTFPAYIRLFDQLDLGIGSTVRAKLLLGEQGAVWIPRDALVRRGDRRLVFRLDEHSAAHAVDVEEQAERGDWLAIRGTVAAGDDLVTEGNENLRDGQKVAAEPGEYRWP